MMVEKIYQIKNKIFFFLFFTILLFSSAINNYSNPSSPKKKVEVVVIDAGHGGRDPGALGKKSKEKDIVLAISLKVGKYIEENFDDVKVIYTRTDDVFIPLHERAAIANKHKADLFISIHANANENRHVIGTESYAMGIHKTQDNLEVAKLENSVIYMEEDHSTNYQGFDPNSVESYIIFSLMQNIHLDQSLYFASYVQNQFRERALRPDRGVKQAGFLVLWQTSMPSVLVECGFISNEKEEEFLNSEQGQDYLASAIYRAFKDYKYSIETKSAFKDIEEIQVSEIDQQKSDVKTASKTDVMPTIRFKAQIISSGMQIPLNSAYFSDLDHVEEFHSGHIFKYAAGNAASYDEMKKNLKQIREKYPDAFIIAVKNNEIIPVQDAIKELKR